MMGFMGITLVTINTVMLIVCATVTSIQSCIIMNEMKRDKR